MKLFKNLKIKEKLITCFILFAVVTGMVGLFGIYSMYTINTRAENMYTNAMSVENMSAEAISAQTQTLAENTANFNSDCIVMVVIMALGIAIAVGVGLKIAKTITQPLNLLVGSAEKIAGGDLDVDIHINTGDEIADLGRSFQKMTDHINDVMTSIDSAAIQVAAGSKQIADSSMGLSQGATEQASSIEQLTASIEEISSQTKLNANNASEASELAESTKEDALQGNSEMKLMLQSMEEINESSNNISKIIKVIEEIAFQTNILALNAAVEAARARQHGKGFAVVAEEVRNLAARSADAAKETTAMIEGSIKKVDHGTQIATKTAAALNKIVGDVTKVSDIVGEIATASNEQAIGISQINQGIMQVSEVVQMNTATSEESAAASEELSSQAELLREQAERFNLKKVSHYSYRGTEESKSDIEEILRNLSSSNNVYSNKRGNQPSFETNELASNPTHIVLNDNEFGKY
ncbi:HAMP domain-containing protein [Acetobacterium fimetarium]|uniref:HAMP domain-containing protein n=1 Tax=Acetobacterium fimetarium TaxID=52691 RepID=A0ABR6WSE2_9FIRM|nr:methyl-accepting chemotaxis protein [Acetobacterium fimetarium]MBC3803219.1 HAMP domain-containing protein [Acetobacterium fimetarium]